MTDFSFQRMKNGKTKIVAKENGHSFAVSADLLDPEDQGRALDKITKRLPALDREDLAELLDEQAAKPEPPSDTLAERLLIHLRQSGLLELFHTPDGEACAFVCVQKSKPAATGESDLRARWETMRISSSSFRSWLNRQAFVGLGKVPSGDTMQSVTNGLIGDALFVGEERSVFVRVGACDGKDGPEVWLDLANEARELVCIARSGWSIVPADEAPIRFLRTRGMLAHPTPARGGSIGELRSLVNVAARQWVLLIGFLVMAFRAHGPYPILMLNGEQGSAKSMLALLLRLLVDPNEANNRRPPKDPQSLCIAARNGWLLSFDNLSGIQAWFADDLCALVTGGGFATRELYTDADEVIFKGARPVILNGIEDLGTRPDLGDRGVHLVLEPIDEEDRREEATVLADFEAARPRILGALLDAVAVALAREASIHLDRKPRLADFARWVEAAAPSLGLQPGEFLRLYFENRSGTSTIAVESSPFGVAIREKVEELGDWSGSVSQLLEMLSTDERKRLHDWPKTGKKASGDLRRLAPALRACGIGVKAGERDPKSRRTTYRLWKLPARSSESSEPSAPEGDEPEDPERSERSAGPLPEDPPSTKGTFGFVEDEFDH